MNEQAEALKRRTRQFAVRIVGLYRLLMKSEEGRVIGRQLLRSGTSVAANYRAVCRARSKAEFTAKMGIVVEEADESLFWLELFEECGMLSRGVTAELKKESAELLAIFAASLRTARGINRSMGKRVNG